MLGLLGLGLHLYLIPKRHKAGYAMAVSIILGICLFIAMLVYRWFFYDIHLS